MSPLAIGADNGASPKGLHAHPPDPVARAAFGRRARASAVLVYVLCTFVRPAWAGPVGAEFQINIHTTSSQDDAAVAADADGDFVVIWTSYALGYPQDGSSTGVFGQRYASTGAAVGSEFQVNTFTGGDQLRAAVAADADGDFVVVWDGGGVVSEPGDDGSGRGVRAQRYASSGAALGSEFQVNTYTTYNQDSPAVAADADGDFVVVWISGGVFGQRYTSTGTAVGSEFQVNTEANDEPAVAAATDGDFVVVWTSVEQDGNLRGVFGQRYTSTGTALGSEFQVNTYTTSFQYAPAVAVTADGHFVVAWTSYSQDGDAHGVFGQRYTSTGAGLGSEFQVNTYTTSSQYEDRGVAVAADADGDFVVVWTSTPDQDGDAHGVFGQRFDLLCGDGNLDPGEGCDDGNTTSGDGCSALCQVETCFSCTGAPSICTPITACTNADSCCPPSCTPGNDDDCAIIPAVTPFGWVLLTGLLVTVMTWRLRRREGRRGR